MKIQLQKPNHNPADPNCPMNADPRNETCGCSVIPASARSRVKSYAHGYQRKQHRAKETFVLGLNGFRVAWLYDCWDHWTHSMVQTPAQKYLRDFDGFVRWFLL